MSQAPEIAAPVEEAVPPPAPAAVHRTVIEPPGRWEAVDWRELWRYRELLMQLTWRDISVRYKQTAFGVAWAVLQPAMMMVVFTVFFGRLAKVPSGGVPYPLFVLSGLILWTFFSAAVINASNSVVGSERLITKIYFPRLSIPFAAVGAAAFDFLVACGLLAVVALWYGVIPSVQLLFAPAVFAVTALFATGVGTFLAALNVSFRDFRYVTGFLVQLGLFATPTIYMQPGAADGEAVRWLLILNPMTSLVAGFRACALGGELPWAGLASALVLAVAAFAVGTLFFRRAEDAFADVI